MSPLQIAATSVLLLACVYLSLGAHVPTRRETATTGDTSCMDDIDDIIKKRTGTEAINAKTAVDDYFKDAKNDKDLDVSAHCQDLGPYPRVEECTCMACMVNVSTNLQYLLSMYSHALGLIYQNSTSNAGSSGSDEAATLDFLEMTFSRFSNQMQRYLQAGKDSCGETLNTTMRNICINHQEIDDGIRNMTQPANVILCQLRGVAKAIMFTLKEEHCPLRGYKFCSNLADLNRLCFMEENTD